MPEAIEGNALIQEQLVCVPDVAYPEVTPFWSYFLVGSCSTGTRKSSTGRSMHW